MIVSKRFRVLDVRNGLRRLIRSAKKSSALAKDQIVVEYLDKLAQKNGKYDGKS